MTTAVNPEVSAPEKAEERLVSRNPATGEVVGEFPVFDDAAVAETVSRAHDAAAWWAGLGFAERRRRLLIWKSLIARYIGRLAELVHQENGKPVPDAQLEIVLGIVHIDWAARNAAKVLGPRRTRGGMLALNMAATVEYHPYGVVGVIGPWNYPVFTPLGSIAYALAAGNAVVFKPSEYTPAVGRWLAETFAEAVPEHPVLQVVTGYGPTGAALAAAPVGKIAFTGSTATAKKVMAACATNLTPMVAECGGKDALIVDRGADLDAAARAAVWGAMSNAGQTCVGVERVYVVDEAYDDFLAKVSEMATNVRAGDDREADYGPITMPGQVDVISRHIDDALGRGGRAVVGGAESVRRPYVDPVVLADVPEDSAAVREETFGPTVTVTRVADADEAVERANATRYGLAATVFSPDRRRAMDIARRLRCGMTAINSVVSFAGIPTLPFGGVGDSGFGRIHGEDGLREFARAKAISRQRFRLGAELTSFARPDKAMKQVLTLINLRHGKRPK